MPQGIQIEILTDTPPIVTSGNFSPGNILYKSETGVFYPNYNPSGFITNADVAGDLNNVLFTTGRQTIIDRKTFDTSFMLDGGGGEKVYFSQKNNNEFTFALNVDPNNGDALDVVNDSAFKFGMMTTDAPGGSDGYNGLHLQSIQAGQDTWGSSQTVLSIDVEGNIITNGSINIGGSASTNIRLGNDFSNLLTIKCGDNSSLAGVLMGDVYSTPANVIAWNGTCSMHSVNDGQIVFTNSAQNGFNQLNLGPANSSFPMLKVVGTTLQIRLGDDSGDANISFANAISQGTSPIVTIQDITQFGNYTVGSLLFKGQIFTGSAGTFYDLGEIRIDKTASDGSAGSSLVLGAQDGGGTLQDRLTIDSSGNVVIGGSITTNGGTMTSPLTFGTSTIGQGTFDSGRGGNFGISLTCTVDYELNWQAGYLTFQSLNAGGNQVSLFSPSSGILTMQDGNTAQIINIGGAFSDGSNYTTLSVGQFDGSNTFVINAQGAGTHINSNLNIGTNESGDLNLVTDNTIRWKITSQGHLWAPEDGVLNIGDSGGARPANGYFTGQISADSLLGSIENAAVASTGTFVINGSPSDGQTITVSDGSNTVTFTYRDSPSAPNDFSLVNNIPSWFATVFNESGLAITASYDSNITVTFTSNNPGASGNISITSNLSNITVTGMSGGSDLSYYWSINHSGNGTFSTITTNDAEITNGNGVFSNLSSGNVDFSAGLFDGTIGGRTPHPGTFTDLHLSLAGGSLSDDGANTVSLTGNFLSFVSNFGGINFNVGVTLGGAQVLLEPQNGGLLTLLNPINGSSTGSGIGFQLGGALINEAANTLALVNGTNAQTFNIYQEKTDNSNYSRLSIDTTGATAAFNIEELGTGVGTLNGFTFNQSISLSDSKKILWNNDSNHYISVTLGSGMSLNDINGIFLNGTTYIADVGKICNVSMASGTGQALVITPYFSGGDVPLVAQGFGGGQSADIQQWRASNTAVLAKMTATGNFDTTGTVHPGQFTMAQLNALTPSPGDEAVCNDSTLPMAAVGYGNIPLGGGSSIVPVVFDGTNWVAH